MHAWYRLQDFLISGATFPFPETDQPVVSVILILHGRAEFTFGCLRSLKENSHLPIEIIAIDDCSNYLNGELFKRVRGVRYIRNPENQRGVCETNQGAELARGKYLLLLDSAAELTPGTLEAAVKALETNPSWGAVGGRLILPDGTLQEAGAFIWEEGVCQGYGRGNDPTSGPYMFPRLVDYCSKAFLMTPRCAWNRLGGWDQVFAPTHYGEADYCMRLWQAGHPVRYEPRAAVWLFDSSRAATSSSPPELASENRRLFAVRHAEALRGRPIKGSVPDLMMRSRSMAPRRRVLLCDALLPHPKRGSGFPRANRMVRSLLDLGCEVACLPTLPGGDPGESWLNIAADIPLEAEILALRCIEKLDVWEILSERHGYYDYLIVSRPVTKGIVQPFLTRHPKWSARTALVYDAEAIVALRAVHQGRLKGKAVSEAEVEASVGRELSLCAGFKKILTVSNGEAAQFRKHGFDAHVVGHAVDIVPGEEAWATRQDILFVGAILDDGYPNADAVFWFLDQVWPELRRRLPWSRFIIAGPNRSERLNSRPLAERVVLTGAVDDLTPFYGSARAFVAPTRVSSGIPLKVIEAAGRGVPVVATTQLIAQLGWDSPREILGADGGPEFVDACVTLCTEERSWQLQREAALARVTAEYSSAVFAGQLQRALGI